MNGRRSGRRVAGVFLAIVGWACSTAKGPVTMVAAAQSPAAAIKFVINPPAATLQPGGNQSFTPVVTWADGRSHPFTVKYNGDGGVITAGGVYTAGTVAGTYSVRATCSCGLTAEADILIRRQAATVAPDQSPELSQAPNVSELGGTPNQPAGFLPLLDYAVSPPSPYSVNDAGAPRSGPVVYEQPYPIGFTDLTSPRNIDVPYPARGQVYLSGWMKLSNPWQFHVSSVNKLFYLGSNATTKFNSEIVVAVKGLSAQASEVCIAVQLPTSFNGGAYLCPNVNRPGFAPGQWHRLEILMLGNHAGQPNGVLRWWVDGSLAGSYANIPFNPTGDGMFDALHIHPIWGGQGGVPKAENDYIRYDHFFVSGR